MKNGVFSMLQHNAKKWPILGAIFAYPGNRMGIYMSYIILKGRKVSYK